MKPGAVIWKTNEQRDGSCNFCTDRCATTLYALGSSCENRNLQVRLCAACIRSIFEQYNQLKP